MSYKNWNEFFLSSSDDRKYTLNSRDIMRETDAFENAYRAMYGFWMSDHYIILREKYGAAAAGRMVDRNAAALSREKLRAAELEKRKHDWHTPDEQVPF